MRSLPYPRKLRSVLAALAVLSAVSCGRIGFDRLTEEDAGKNETSDPELGLSLAEDLVKCPIVGTPSSEGTEAILAYAAYRPNEADAEIRLSRIAADGTPVLGPVIVASAGQWVEVVGVFADPSYGYAVFFQTAGTVRVVRVDTGGAVIDEKEVATDVLESTVAVTASGFLVAYADAGRRLQTVQVDAAGNASNAVQLAASGRFPISIGIGGDVLLVYFEGVTVLTKARRLSADGSQLAALDLFIGTAKQSLAFDETTNTVAFVTSRGPDREEFAVQSFDVSSGGLVLGANSFVVGPNNREEYLEFSVGRASGVGYYLIRKSDAFTANSQVAIAQIPDFATTPSLSQFTTGATEVFCPIVVSTNSGPLIAWIQDYMSTRALKVTPLATP